MLKKTVKYTDLNGDVRSEDLFFNLSKIEIARMQNGFGEKFSDKLTKASESLDAKLIMAVFEELISLSYGEKSADGRHFIKVRNGVRLSEEFMQGSAYEALYESLLDNPEEAKAFMLGVIPPLPEGTDLDALVKNG